MTATERMCRRYFWQTAMRWCFRLRSSLPFLDAVRELFPNCVRVASYGTAQDILRKSEEELRQLKEAGLGIVYVGAESGDDEILREMQQRSNGP